MATIHTTKQAVRIAKETAESINGEEFYKAYFVQIMAVGLAVLEGKEKPVIEALGEEMYQYRNVYQAELSGIIEMAKVGKLGIAATVEIGKDDLDAFMEESLKDRDDYQDLYDLGVKYLTENEYNL